MDPLAIFALAKRFWKPLAGVALALTVWWSIHHYGAVQYKAGVATELELWKAAEKQAADEHDRRIAEINDEHHKSELSLQSQLQSALDHPVTRTIRVPYSTACKNQPAGTQDAGLPPAANPAGEFVDIDDPGFEGLRQWLTHYAGGPSAGSGAVTPVSH